MWESLYSQWSAYFTSKKSYQWGHPMHNVRRIKWPLENAFFNGRELIIQEKYIVLYYYWLKELKNYSITKSWLNLSRLILLQCISDQIGGLPSPQIIVDQYFIKCSNIELPEKNEMKWKTYKSPFSFFYYWNTNKLSVKL